MSEKTLTNAEVKRLRDNGITYPWTAWQSLKLLDRIDKQKAVADRDVKPDNQINWAVAWLKLRLAISNWLESSYGVQTMKRQLLEAMEDLGKEAIRDSFKPGPEISKRYAKLWHLSARRWRARCLKNIKEAALAWEAAADYEEKLRGVKIAIAEIADMTVMEHPNV